MHAAVFDEPAPEPEEEFDDDCCGHDGYCHASESNEAVIGAGEFVEAFESDLHEGGDHYDGEDEDADWFEAPAADRVGVLVVAADEAGGGPDDGCAEEVEGCVYERCEDRNGRAEDDDDDFHDEQDGVGGEVEVDGDGHDAGLGASVLFGLEERWHAGFFVGCLGGRREERGVLVFFDAVDVTGLGRAFELGGAAVWFRCRGSGASWWRGQRRGFFRDGVWHA